MINQDEFESLSVPEMKKRIFRHLLSQEGNLAMVLRSMAMEMCEAGMPLTAFIGELEVASVFVKDQINGILNQQIEDAMEAAESQAQANGSVKH